MNFPVLPYTPISIDTNYSHINYAVSQCFCSHDDSCRKEVESNLRKLWTSTSNPNHVMTLLSVRTGFDLFLKAKAFPEGSEVIMSAINIPDMSKIVQSHGLVVVPLDISIDTLEPKIDLLPYLISPKTVAIVFAHLYGRVINMQPFIDICKQYGLVVIEDCAESFCGFNITGHPSSDISLFSFGVIKFYTSFGGSIAKIRDQDVYDKMLAIHKKYPTQTNAMYLKKLLKYSVIYTWLQDGILPKVGREVLNKLGVDYKAVFVNLMRGFPNQMLEMIRWQPSLALLSTMLQRQQGFLQSEFNVQKVKGEYFLCNLPAGYEPVGHQTLINNFWLFPVLVEDPDTMVHLLNLLGVDAYRGATQLNIIEPGGGDDTKGLFGPASLGGTATLNNRYPHEGKHLIDHVVYLPVNKLVPFHILDKMLKACTLAIELSQQPDRRSLRSRNAADTPMSNNEKKKREHPSSMNTESEVTAET